jgi:ATP-dependent protease HslVU (ClpYQ) peptidase subunit
MSVIVGIVRSGVIHMGADSYVGSGWDCGLMSTPKIFELGEMVIGFSGDVSVLNAIRYRLKVPEHGEEETDEAFLAVKVADALRGAIGEAGRLMKKDDVESTRASMLIGYRGNLYRIGSEFSVLRRAQEYEAVGAGEDYALGALFAGKKNRDGVKKILTTALMAASQHSAVVSPPFVFISKREEESAR